MRYLKLMVVLFYLSIFQIATMRLDRPTFSGARTTYDPHSQVSLFSN
ncbi:MAG: hypothetical protein ABI539_01700 [Acidobacteriota bacterium]